MCNLCDPDTKAKEIHRLHRVSEELRVLAGKYIDMAEGRIKPHDSKGPVVVMKSQALSVVRTLVEEWV